ncbi:MAG: hypothetical protein WA966_01910, partial [Ornithinimicrobium sp.]
ALGTDPDADPGEDPGGDPGEAADRSGETHLAPGAAGVDHVEEGRSTRQMVRDLPWRRIAALSGALFAVSMILIVAFELSTGRAVSTYTGGSTDNSVGTSIPGWSGTGENSLGNDDDGPDVPAPGEGQDGDAPPGGSPQDESDATGEPAPDQAPDQDGTSTDAPSDPAAEDSVQDPAPENEAPPADAPSQEPTPGTGPAPPAPQAPSP